MNRMLLAPLALVLGIAALPGSKSTQQPNRKASAATSMSTVVAASAAASAENSALRRSKQTTLGKPSPSSAKAGGAYTVTQVDLPAALTGTGFMERIQIMTPFGYNPAGPDVPLLLIGNGYGLSAGSFFNGMSDLPDEANNRGWLLVVVTQLDDKSFGAWNKPQGNVTAALQHMLNNYRVDAERIYAIGWSMSGGSLASYAARHLDPAKPMIAAVVVNAGSLDLVDTYNNEVVGVKTIMENVNLFQGNPALAAFHYNYERTETVFTSPSTGALNATYCQARNLRNIPIYHVYSNDDTIPYLPQQNTLFDTYLTSIGANLTTQTFSGLATPHSWDLVDPIAALDWCQQFTTNRSPPSYELNADRSGVFYWTTLTQRTAGAFSRLEVDADAATNTLSILGSENLSAIEVSPQAGQLDFGTRLTILVDNTDPQPLQLELRGAGLVNPTYILDGNDIFEDWTYDGSSVVLEVSASSTHTFTVAFDSYTAVLTAPATVNLGSSMNVALQGSVPNRPYLMLLSTFVFPTPVALIDPTDTRYVLAGFDASTVLLLSNLGPLATQNFSIFIPANPTYQNVNLAMQFMTYPGLTTIIDEISNLEQCLLQ